MSSRFAVLVLDATDPELVAGFWCQVLGWQVLEREGGDIGIGPAPSSSPAGGTCPTIDVLQVPERKTLKNRLHLDLRADGTDTATELERLLALGARRVDVGQDPGSTWEVLADPEGNEFCLLSATVQQIETARREAGSR